MRAAELIAPLTFRLTEMPLEDPGARRSAGAASKPWASADPICTLIPKARSAACPTPIPWCSATSPPASSSKPAPASPASPQATAAPSSPRSTAITASSACSGHHNVCANIRFLSNPNHPGFFREFVNLPATNFAPIPQKLSLDQAALSEPLAIALHSVHLAAISARETVAVIGAGPIGLLTIAALRAVNAGRIWAIEPLAHRRELARAMGADAALEPGEAVAEILRATGQRGVDCAIDCAAGAATPSRKPFDSRAMPAASCSPAFTPRRPHRRCLRHAPQGTHALQRAPLQPRNRRGSVICSRRSPIGSHRSSPHTRPLDRIDEAFDLTSHYRDGVGKMVIRP